MKIILFILTFIVCGYNFSYSATNSDIEKMTAYAVILGRGSACSADNIENYSRRVGRWIDNTFTQSEKKTIFTNFYGYYGTISKKTSIWTIS